MLQLGTIPTVEPENHDFECPECWRHPVDNACATFFRRFINLACNAFTVRKFLDSGAVQSGHLPHGPAAGQTGDVASADATVNDTIGVTGALAAPSDEAPAETPSIASTKVQEENSEAMARRKKSEAMENFKGQMERSRIDSDENFEKYEKSEMLCKSIVSADSSPMSTKICMKIPVDKKPQQTKLNSKEASPWIQAQETA